MSAERPGPSVDPLALIGLRPAVFLDRDGTINVEVDHLCQLEDLQLLPGTVQGLSCLREAGYALVIVTNQSAVARGLLTEAGLAEIHRELERQLALAGTGVDAIYYCPHHPEQGIPPYRQDCFCRKPSPGLLQRAAADLGLDLKRSYMVGDALADLEAGWRAGCRAILVLTGYGERTRQEMEPALLSRVDYIAEDLAAAAAWIVGQPQ